MFKHYNQFVLISVRKKKGQRLFIGLLTGRSGMLDLIEFSLSLRSSKGNQATSLGLLLQGNYKPCRLQPGAKTVTSW